MKWTREMRKIAHLPKIRPEDREGDGGAHGEPASLQKIADYTQGQLPRHCRQVSGLERGAIIALQK
jgi:hypothetical protein